MFSRCLELTNFCAGLNFCGVFRVAVASYFAGPLLGSVNLGAYLSISEVGFDNPVINEIHAYEQCASTCHNAHVGTRVYFWVVDAHILLIRHRERLCFTHKVHYNTNNS